MSSSFPVVLTLVLLLSVGVPVHFVRNVEDERRGLRFTLHDAVLLNVVFHFAPFACKAAVACLKAILASATSFSTRRYSAGFSFQRP